MTGQIEIHLPFHGGLDYLLLNIRHLERHRRCRVDHVFERRLCALEEMVERFRGGDIRDNRKFHLALPSRVGFDNIICFFLRAHRRGDGVSALLAS